MAKTDWTLYDTVQPEDMNALGEEMNGHGSAISALEGRLNNAEYEEITLQPGLQVINAKKDSLFRFGEMKGRTLINLVGGVGSCESLSPFVTVNSVAVNNSKVKDGSSSLKATTTNNNAYVFKDISVSLEKTKQYLLAGWVFVESYTQSFSGGAAIQLRDYGTMNGIYSAAADPSIIGEWQFIFTKIPKSNTLVGSGFRLLFGLTGVSTGTAYFDSIRLYEISNDEYNALDGMTAEQISVKYPFVPSGIVGVNGPYAIGYGGNMLPPFYEWLRNANLSIVSPYKATLNATAAFHINNYRLTLPEGMTFTFSCEFSGDVGGYVHIRAYDATDATMPALNYITNQTKIGKHSLTFTIPSGAIYVEFVFTSKGPGVFTLENPMLVIGSEAKPFISQKKSMLSFQTELHTQPVNGSDSDVLFEKEGQYYKLAKWKKTLASDGKLFELWNTVDFTGYKVVIVSGVLDGSLSSGDDDDSGHLFVTDHMGRALIVDDTGVEAWASPGRARNFGNKLYVTISNADSGWSDNYSPTADEIKAYFMGWRMANPSNWGVPYSGNGTKAWGKLNGNGNLVSGSGTETLPTMISDAGYKPYQILYRLTKETIEPVVSEGMMTLHEGNNIVEVGTEIVLREKANPVLATPSSDYYINKWDISSTHTKYKTRKFIQIYKDNSPDYSWTIQDTPTDTELNMQRSYISASSYNVTSSYSVTYIKRDRSPVVPITGTLSVNEKAQICDLTAGLTDVVKRLSVVEQKKAEKDNPGWITPTLLNGWVLSSNGVFPAQYYKDSMGIVHVNGIVTGGTTETVVFKLPSGYRPKMTNRIPSIIMSGTVVYNAYLDVKASGDVVAVFPTPSTHLTLNMSFLAEQ